MRSIDKNRNRVILAVILCMALICGTLGAGANVATAASKVRISQKSMLLAVGASSKLKISGTTKKVTWTSSKESVAGVSTSGKVKAKKEGTTTVTAKVGGKKYKCKVTVKESLSQEEKVLEIVNQKRGAKGLNPLKMDAKLQKAANARAKEIVKKFDHVRPNGKKCYTILKSYGVTYHACGENIAEGQKNAKEVMNDWMHSSGHKANILDPSYSRLGVGLYKNPKNKKYYWVQIFTD